ncbi:hypothetical protein B0T22DRAFT_109972 [Podospora appendiculata]|uniref:Uncharacterized protein n=1 Tax=Podospora appendiculata TaxID=314037 RepID=A0AAE1CIG2_9PEZI|nr:hypothetical protein B0T22DRAFT_109972 [Podospora appendiculata]
MAARHGAQAWGLLNLLGRILWRARLLEMLRSHTAALEASQGVETNLPDHPAVHDGRRRGDGGDGIATWYINPEGTFGPEGGLSANEKRRVASGECFSASAFFFFFWRRWR